MNNEQKEKIQEMATLLENLEEEIRAIAEEEDRKREGFGKVPDVYDEVFEMVECLYTSIRHISEGKIALESALYFSDSV